MPAPIVLFVYNRPEHTLNVLNSLKNAQLSGQSKLIIYSDGPRSARDRQKVETVRKILQDASGFNSIEIRASEENLGLARSIIKGVTAVVNEYGHVIVLEDDLVVSPYFLDYMNNALEYYKEVENIMHVSAYWYPSETKLNSETFLLRYPSSWGWATWDHAWQWFEKDPLSLYKMFSKDDIKRFNFDGEVDIWEQVVHNLNGKANTWAVFWYASIFRRNALCLYPAHSLVQNIGMDGSGEHCLATNAYDNMLHDWQVTNFTDDLNEDGDAVNCFKQFHIKNRVSRMARFYRIYLAMAKKYLPNL